MGGAEQGRGGIILTQFPDHQPTQLVVHRIRRFVPDREGIVVGPEGVAIKEPGCLRLRIAIQGGLRRERFDVAVGPVASNCLTFLKQPTRLFRDQPPAVAVEGNAH